MSQSSPQFTVAQILEAGRQAEAGGNREYAIQFYRHLSENHPHSIEAASARESMSRLLGIYAAPAPAVHQHPAIHGDAEPEALNGADGGIVSAGQAPSARLDPTMGPAVTAGAVTAGQGDQMGLGPATAPAPAADYGSANIYSGAGDATLATGIANGAMPPANLGGASAHGQQLTGRNTGHAYPPQQDHQTAPAARMYPAPVPVAPSEQHPPIPSQFLLPSVQNHYRMGQFLATVSSIVGWIMALMGIAAVLAGLGSLPGLDPVMVQSWLPNVPSQYGMLAGLLIGAAWVIMGLVMIFFAQLARAVFDNANASRDLVAIERARVRQGGSKV